MDYKTFKKIIIEKRKEILSDEDKFNIEIAKMVTEIRIKRGITQKKLSKLTGIKQSSLSRLESGNSGFVAGNLLLLKIAKALNTELIPPKFACLVEETPSIELSANKSDIISTKQRAKTIIWSMNPK